MIETDTQQLLALLWQSVERLSQPAEVQIAWLGGQSLSNADELALEFDDVYPAISQLAGATHLSDTSLQLLHRLSGALDELSNDPARWELKALAEDRGWMQARALAADILAEVRRAA
jgi:hypothetical protein